MHKLFSKKPGVADIAVERRLEKNQEKPDFTDLSAVVLAGESMREFMRLIAPAGPYCRTNP